MRVILRRRSVTTSGDDRLSRLHNALADVASYESVITSRVEAVATAGNILRAVMAILDNCVERTDVPGRPGWNAPMSADEAEDVLIALEAIRQELECTVRTFGSAINTCHALRWMPSQLTDEQRQEMRERRTRRRIAHTARMRKRDAARREWGEHLDRVRQEREKAAGEFPTESTE